MKGTAESYRVVIRNWWRWERNAPMLSGGVMVSGNGRHLVPDPGARRTTLARGCTEAEAQAICREYARTHKPGPLSRKAEYERER